MMGFEIFKSQALHFLMAELNFFIVELEIFLLTRLEIL
jgi:hypothetical protein